MSKLASVIEICPLLDDSMLDEHIIEFMQMNPEGVRNCDVARAIGIFDPKQWLSYSALQRLIAAGKVVKEGRMYRLTAPTEATA